MELSHPSIKIEYKLLAVVKLPPLVPNWNSEKIIKVIGRYLNLQQRDSYQSISELDVPTAEVKLNNFHCLAKLNKREFLTDHSDAPILRFEINNESIESFHLMAITLTYLISSLNSNSDYDAFVPPSLSLFPPSLSFSFPLPLSLLLSSPT